ncbi:MAG: hypothetical protein V1798_06855 [Pseudomonadota bacterium]
MSKATRCFWGLLVALAGVGFSGSRAEAQDRTGYVGQSVILPYQFNPTTGRGDSAYAIDIGMALTERWFGRASVEFALQGAGRIGLAVGPEVYFGLPWMIKPLATVQALYVFSPTSDFGVRGAIGAEWNLKFLTGIDNLRFTLQSGVLAILKRQVRNQIYWETARAGFSWNF